MKLVVVGLGLIGGSVALAARERLGAEVVGADLLSVVSSPLAQQAVSRTVDVERASDLAAAFAESDLTILSAPVRVIERLVEPALEHAPIVTDTGSTKRSIAARAGGHPRAKQLVPGHPMAGRPEGGLEHARADLFEGRPWITCPEASDPTAADRVATLAESFGAQPVRMTLEAHDRAVALTSHAPQLIASALSGLAEEWEASPAIGPGFERMTQGAGGAAPMWGDILATNADEIAGVLRALIARLDEAAVGLEAEPPATERSLELLARARGLRR